MHGMQVYSHMHACLSKTVYGFLHIATKPVIEEFPCTIVAVEGQKVKFKVRVSGTPVPKFRWYEGDRIILGGSQFVVEEGGSLVILAVQSQDSGLYKLVAENAVGSVSQETTLVVTSNEPHQETYAASHTYTAITKKSKSVNPVSLDEFESFVTNHHSDSDEGFHALFSVRQEMCAG